MKMTVVEMTEVEFANIIKVVTEEYERIYNKATDMTNHALESKWITTKEAVSYQNKRILEMITTLQIFPSDKEVT